MKIACVHRGENNDRSESSNNQIGVHLARDLTTIRANLKIFLFDNLKL